MKVRTALAKDLVFHNTHGTKTRKAKPWLNLFLATANIGETPSLEAVPER